MKDKKPNSVIPDVTKQIRRETMDKKLYVLTDGDDVYETREMDSVDLLKAEEVAKETWDGELFWMPAKDLPEARRYSLA